MPVPLALWHERGIKETDRRLLIALWGGLYSLIDWDEASSAHVIPVEKLMAAAGFTRHEQLERARALGISLGYFTAVFENGTHTTYTILNGPTPTQARSRTNAQNARGTNAQNARGTNAQNARALHSPEFFPEPSLQDAREGRPDDPATAAWSALAAALPLPLAEKVITGKHRQRVLDGLAQLRERGWTDAELVAALVTSDEWPPLRDAKVPALAFIARARTLAERTPPHVAAHLRARAEAERMAVAEAERENLDHADALRDAVRVTGDAVLAQLNPMERAWVGAHAENDARDDGSVVSGRVVGPAARDWERRRALEWAGVPGPALHRLAAQRPRARAAGMRC